MAATTANITTVNSSASAQQLLGAADRYAAPGSVSVTIANNSTAILYVLIGSGTPTSSNFSFAIGGNASGVLDRSILDYRGPVQGIWASANGNAVITEYI